MRSKGNTVSFTQTPNPVASGVRLEGDALHVDLRDGRSLTVPVAWFPWLAALEPAEREQYELIGEGTGIWWTAPDEGISVPALFGLPCE
jgi:hypothetical protein